MQYSSEERLAQKLLEVLAEAVTVVEARVAAVDAGRRTRFSFVNPVSGRSESAEGEAFESLTPGSAVAVYLENERRWLLLSSSRFEVGGANVDQFVRRRPPANVDRSRLPAVVSMLDGEEVKLGLIDGDYWTPFASIPYEINGCPPNDDPDAPPLPAGEGYPGYFVYYFSAHFVGVDSIDGHVDAPGMPSVGAGFHPYWGRMGYSEFPEPRIADVEPGDNENVRIFTASLLASTVFGLYGISYPEFTRFNVVLDDLKASGSRIDFSTWTNFQRYDGLFGTMAQQTVQLYGFEVVASLVKGVPQAGGGFLPPLTPPAPPSGVRARVIPNYHAASFLLSDAVIFNNSYVVNAGHAWERRNRPPNPPAPPDGSDPNRPPDGEPDYPLRPNPYQVLLTADRSSNYVLVRHSPDCEEPPVYQEHQVYKITNGNISSGPLSLDDWRATYLDIGQIEPSIQLGKCVKDALSNPKVNLLGPRTYEVKPAESDVDGSAVAAELEKLIAGGVCKLDVETFQFDPEQVSVSVCDRRSLSVKPVVIKAPGLPAPVRQQGPQIEAYAPILWRA